MGPVTAQLLDELGYDPDDGLPDLTELARLSGLGSSDDTRDFGKLGELAHRALGATIPIGEVIAARAGAQRVAVARLASGRLVVVADECPHDGGRISDGFVEGERLICARHGWQLEPRDGRCERVCKLRE